MRLKGKRSAFKTSSLFLAPNTFTICQPSFINLPFYFILNLVPSIARVKKIQ